MYSSSYPTAGKRTHPQKRYAHLFFEQSLKSPSIAFQATFFVFSHLDDRLQKSLFGKRSPYSSIARLNTVPNKIHRTFPKQDAVSWGSSNNIPENPFSPAPSQPISIIAYVGSLLVLAGALVEILIVALLLRPVKIYSVLVVLSQHSF